MNFFYADIPQKFAHLSFPIGETFSIASAVFCLLLDAINSCAFGSQCFRYERQSSLCILIFICFFFSSHDV